MIDVMINIDCRDGMKSIPDKSIDMVCTDLPYGITRNKWDTPIPFDDLWGGINRIIKDNGAIILFASGMFMADLMKSNCKMWHYNLIYEKANASGFLNANRMPLRAHEDICVFYKCLPTYNPQMKNGMPVKRVRKTQKATSKCYGNYTPTDYESTQRYPRSVWRFSNENGYHQTQKPVKLIEELIKTYSNPNDTVLDICAGSMTAAIAAVNTGRHYICFEKDPDIFSNGVKRFNESTNGGHGQ